MGYAVTQNQTSVACTEKNSGGFDKAGDPTFLHMLKCHYFTRKSYYCITFVFSHNPTRV